MKIVIAIDSFKESMTSIEAGEAAADGIKRVMPDAEIIINPLADGGEGTTKALTIGMKGHFENLEVTGPLGNKVEAEYGILGDHRTAVMEMASAAGLTLIPPAKRNPLKTTTYGVGEMIHDAITKGCRNFIIGIGGSATNDGGIGMLQALGFSITNEKGQPVTFGANGLKELSSISELYTLPELKECNFRIACDVTNPLCGKNGCSNIYGPQKGATVEIVQEMDQWMEYYASISKELIPEADRNYPGTGAAGGLGFAFRTFLNSTLEPGVDIILKETKLEQKIKEADLVITGEGRLDAQTVMGKAPIGVAKLAKKYQKPVIAFAGSVLEDANICNEHGIDAYFSIIKKDCTLEEAMDFENAKDNMTDTVEQVMRFLLINR